MTRVGELIEEVMRVALVHDWLLTFRGGEKVLLALAELFPDAPIYTLFHQREQLPQALNDRRIVCSVLNRFSTLRRHHRHCLPLMPMAIRSLSLPAVDLVISSSHCVAKGIRVPSGAKHLSYIHAPLRYMWDRFDDYFGPDKASLPTRFAAHLLRRPLQRWDVSSSRRVDAFIANSAYVKRQVLERYQRDASVVYPPVELEAFTALPVPQGRGDYFLFFGAAVPYKRVDVAIDAFVKLGLPLKIAGVGHRMGAATTLNGNIEFLGEIDRARVPELYRRARALIFPGVEDFGLTPIECMASGRPVIAFERGGALETVSQDTGLFFASQQAEALASAVKRFVERESTFDAARLRAHAQQFSKARFQAQVREQVQRLMGPDAVI
jgi:glycosyltransferase involved in cell wall biosynthesis